MSTAREVIVAVMRDVQGVAKKDRNQAQGFSFRGIDAVVNAVGPALREAGGFIIPTVISNIQTTVPSKNGGSLNVVRLEVKFSIFGSEGDPIEGVVAAEAFDSGDKATAKAMSVAFRTFMLQSFSLPTDEPDPDTHSYEIAQPKFSDPDRLTKIMVEIAKAQTPAELKKVWDSVADIADAPFDTEYGTDTLKAVIVKRKAQIEAEVK